MIDNSLAARWFALSKDSPAKLWWHSPLWNDATGRALGLDRAECAGVYALAPFRIARIDGKALVLAAYPAPRIFAPVDEDWLDIETVIAWNPLDDTAIVLGDPVPQIVGTFAEDATLYASPREFFQRWAQKRAAYAVQRQACADNEWSAPPVEADLAPGALIIGNFNEIRWQTHNLPRDLECVGVDARLINRAILRAANLPRAFQRAA